MKIVDKLNCKLKSTLLCVCVPIFATYLQLFTVPNLTKKALVESKRNPSYKIRYKSKESAIYASIIDNILSDVNRKRQRIFLGIQGKSLENPVNSVTKEMTSLGFTVRPISEGKVIKSQFVDRNSGKKAWQIVICHIDNHPKVLICRAYAMLSRKTGKDLELQLSKDSHGYFVTSVKILEIY